MISLIDWQVSSTPADGGGSAKVVMVVISSTISMVASSKVSGKVGMLTKSKSQK